MTDDVDSEVVADATTSFLADHADGERALEAVLEVDSELSAWTFEDVSIDSGTFGELVSRGIVRKVDGEYQLADPESVQAILDGESVAAHSGDDASSHALSLPSIDWRAMAGLVVALCVVAGARMTAFTSVFQRGYAISPGNDPYYFRYWLGELLAESSGITDFGVLVDAPMVSLEHGRFRMQRTGLLQSYSGGVSGPQRQLRSGFRLVCLSPLVF